MLAVLGAVAMVTAAVLVRQAVDDGDGGNGETGGGDDQVVVVCDPDLRAACDGLDADIEVHTEDAAATSAALVAGTLDDVDGWVTSAAWLELTESRSERPLGETMVLATSEVVLASDADRAEALAALCEGVPVWRCVGDAAEQSWSSLGGDPRWRSLRTGLPDADTATGLSVLTSVAVGFFDGTDFAANDFPELRGWLTKLTDASGSGDSNLLTTLVRVRGTYSAGGLLAADAVGRDQLVALPAEPTVEAVAVLVDLPGGDPLPEPTAARAALVDQGWDAGAGEPVAVLKPGVMAALHTLWKVITS